MIYSKCVLWKSCCTWKGLLNFRKKGNLLKHLRFASKNFKERQKLLQQSGRLQCVDISLVEHGVLPLWSKSGVPEKQSQLDTRSYYYIRCYTIQSSVLQVIIKIESVSLHQIVTRIWIIIRNNDVLALAYLNSALLETRIISRRFVASSILSTVWQWAAYQLRSNNRTNNIPFLS